MNDQSTRLVLVGYPGQTHVGTHLYHAAKQRGIAVDFLDGRQGSKGPRWLTTYYWRFRGHYPSRLKPFGQTVVEVCRTVHPRWLLCTGTMPVERQALDEIGSLGVQRLNYLTDDPWNPTHRARWLFKALPAYDCVFSPRQANLNDLRRLGCPKVSYLPFAYAPEIHFPQPLETAEERRTFTCDLVFFGGADRDRLPWTVALRRTGFQVHLYGGYWDRFKVTRSWARGHADPETLRKALAGAKVALCLVRRANRDGHAMRSFEIPAMEACMLAEDTEEHRNIFGRDGEAVRYFGTPTEMVEKLRWLLIHDEERRRLALAARQLMVTNHHTYQDRLTTMLTST